MGSEYQNLNRFNQHYKDDTNDQHHEVIYVTVIILNYNENLYYLPLVICLFPFIMGNKQL